MEKVSLALLLIRVEKVESAVSATSAAFWSLSEGEIQVHVK